MSDAIKAVFLSYAREDADVARRIAEALRAFGVEVWFDQNELRGGDQWDTKIRTQIKTCALFVPLVSQQTEERAEGYFRREWKIAVDRTHDMAGGRAFIVPVVIDDTKESAAAVPEEFMRYQWTRLAHGEPSPDFVMQVKRLLEAPKKSAVGAGRGSDPPSEHSARERSGQRPALPQTSHSPMVFSALALVAVAAAIYFALRPAPTSTVEPKTAVPSPLAANPAPTAAPVTPDKSTLADKSVAVLAFADLSEARNSEYFSDGVSEELLNVLAKVPGLRVAARTSAFFFKGKNLPIGEIASKLNVAYVVEGSVQRSGENVRITAQLIKAADGYHVWSEHFDRELKNVFAVQDEIAGLIAKQLSLKLGASSAAATAAINPEAFELFVRAREAWKLRTLADYDRAEDLLNRAIALEPNFARAQAALADVWLTRAQDEQTIGSFAQRNSTAQQRIVAKINRALALDPDLAEVHATLGGVGWTNWQTAEGERELRRAITLNANYATAHQWLGRLLLNDGRMDEALAELKLATELDPLAPRILDNYGLGLYCAGRYTEALAVDDRALTLQPNSLQTLIGKAYLLATTGRVVEAVSLVKTLPLDPSKPGLRNAQIQVLARAGVKEQAESMLTGYDPKELGLRAVGLLSLGRNEEAIALLTPASFRAADLANFLFDPIFDPIRNDPRIVKLWTELGATEALARAQAWRAAHPPEKPAAQK